MQIGPHIVQIRTPYPAKQDVGGGFHLEGVVAANEPTKKGPHLVAGLFLPRGVTTQLPHSLWIQWG